MAIAEPSLAVSLCLCKMFAFGRAGVHRACARARVEDRRWFQVQNIMTKSGPEDVGVGDVCYMCGHTCECWPLKTIDNLKKDFVSKPFKESFFAVRAKLEALFANKGATALEVKSDVSK